MQLGTFFGGELVPSDDEHLNLWFVELDTAVLDPDFEGLVLVLVRAAIRVVVCLLEDERVLS